jgi:hypothetical protein
MGLTDEERQRLDNLADRLADEDPRLGRALSDRPLRQRLSIRYRGRLLGSWARHRWAMLWLGVALTAISVPLAIVGLVLRQPLVFAVGALAIVAGPLMVIVTRFGRRKPT